MHINVDALISNDISVYMPVPNFIDAPTYASVPPCHVMTYRFLVYICLHIYQFPAMILIVNICLNTYQFSTITLDFKCRRENRPTTTLFLAGLVFLGKTGFEN